MLPGPIGPEVCGNLDGSRHLEWLVSNGRGAYAMGTVPLMLTRRYHGLLVATQQSPGDRHLLLAKLEPTVTLAGQSYELASNDYPGTAHPHGYQHLERFCSLPWPRWDWRVGQALLCQELFMVPGRDITVVCYRLVEGCDELTLALRPLCTSRNHHLMLPASVLGEPEIAQGVNGLRLHWPHRAMLFLSYNGIYTRQPAWYYDFVLSLEAERGYDWRQDLFCPGQVEWLLRKDSPTAVFAAGSGPLDWSRWTDWQAEAHRHAKQIIRLPERLAKDPLAKPLASAADRFLVAGGREEDSGIIAGFPWFGQWGRDTFIALSGLCLVTARFELARQILANFARHLDAGMIPNCLSDANREPAYNTIDATLWFLHALDRYLAYSHDEAVIPTTFALIEDILDAHLAGTRHGIHCDPADGLLAGGEPGLQLTWMDAKVGDRVITPRRGKPVEVQALWYNALQIAESFAAKLGQEDRHRQWAQLARRCKTSFNERFWNEQAGCLFDVVDCDHQPGATDPTIRCNQVFAISLTHPVLKKDRWPAVVRVLGERLLTPMGLRTLAPGSEGYQPTCRGDQAARDRAYHQGTVWPWLIGPYITAYVKANNSTKKARRQARELLAGFEQHLRCFGLGQICELADAEPPHAPTGCPAQAWSVAEILRALHEDALGLGPA